MNLLCNEFCVIERVNQTINKSLFATTETSGHPGCWIRCLDKVLYAYNSAVHSTTRHRSFDLFFGKKKSRILND